MVKKENRIKLHNSFGDRIFDTFNILFMIVLVIVTLYPFLHVLFASFSDPTQLIQHTGILLKPVGFSIEAYKLVLNDPMILIGYGNTIFYVVVGTVINVTLTALGAYALSRSNVMWARYIMIAIVFTMFFSGGLVPRYLLVNELGMLDTRWALIIPNAISAWNLIIMRTSFQAIPKSLEESARIDGANDFMILFKVVIPLSLPVMAVITLFYAVGHWNSYFDAMIFLRDRGLYPLQLVLRQILVTEDTSASLMGVMGDERYNLGQTIKYATIIVTTVPILFIYPFLQKYFVQGVMVGSIKE